MLANHNRAEPRLASEYVGIDERIDRPAGSDAPLADDRFRTLLGETAWRRLPALVRERFGKRLRGGDSVAYQGIIKQMFMSRAGRAVAHACRLIGAPLPYDRDSIDAPSVVIVTEDTATDGQFWIRQYGRKSGFPQTVQSSKRFAGPTGLEEYIGYGIGMALIIEATETALLFKSDHYFLSMLGLRIRIPGWLTPGRVTVGHHERGNGRFAFTLSLVHPWLGVLIHQKVVFAETRQYVSTGEGL